MLALQVTQVKQFMNHLLLQETFDGFLLTEAYVRQDAAYLVDGRLKEEESGENEETTGIGPRYIRYAKVRPFCLSLIRGQATPAEMRLVLALSDNMSETTSVLEESGISIQDAEMLYLNIRYRNGVLQLTTGTGLRAFRMDRSLEHAWDSWVRSFLQRQNVDFEEV